MNKVLIVLLISILAISCSNNESIQPVNTNTLDYYLSQHDDLEQDILIACAASEPESNEEFGVSVFFYPYKGAQNYRYYETSSSTADPNDYSNYIFKQHETFPVFNGYLRRYKYPDNSSEKWIIITYLTEGIIHVCDPIRLKQDIKPTMYAPDKIDINLDSPLEPIFTWEADQDKENIIYFQVVSDSAGNLISGTYTYDKTWQFYDLTNVVLNIKEQDPPPVLQPDHKYRFTLMGVSEDNWVNLVGEKQFISN